MKKYKVEYAVIGSGAGGATLAYELAKQGKDVIILEKGFIAPRIGTEKSALYYYDKYGKLKSREGVTIYRTIMTGGTTVVSCGNAVRAMEKEFKKYGINLSPELDEAEKDLNVRPMEKEFIGVGTNRIWRAAKKLNYSFRPMPKFIDFTKCVSCGNCILGCAPKAKWSALSYIEKAQGFNAKLITNFTLTSINIKNSRAIGLAGKSNDGQYEIKSDKIILCCGALETPKLLNKLGLIAGKKLFCDLFIVVYGATEDYGMSREPTMAILNEEFHEKEGFIMSPFLDMSIFFASGKPKYYKLAFKREKLLGVMIKIKDDMVGNIGKYGKISKTVTDNDHDKLKIGLEKAKEILLEAGVNRKSLIVIPPRGAHPGGTAAIGDVVDSNQETKIKNLYICDASVLPEAPGVPPILTIIGLAKRLAKIL